jgi:hypothetical protein
MGASTEWSRRIALGVAAVAVTPPDLDVVLSDFRSRESSELVSEYLSDPNQYELDFTALLGRDSEFSQAYGVTGEPAQFATDPASGRDSSTETVLSPEFTGSAAPDHHAREYVADSVLKTWNEIEALIALGETAHDAELLTDAERRSLVVNNLRQRLS